MNQIEIPTDIHEQINVSNLSLQISYFTLQHHFNGPFLIFQTNLLSTRVSNDEHECLKSIFINIISTVLF